MNKTIIYMFENKEDFFSYLDTQISEKNRELLKNVSLKNPTLKEELFIKTKNAMMATIYSENQTRDYINWVLDTLKYMSRYF